jgi:hypothetical protein
MWVVAFTIRPLYPRGRANGTHGFEGWVDIRIGLAAMTKKRISPSVGNGTHLPSCSQSPLVGKLCPAKAVITFPILGGGDKNLQVNTVGIVIVYSKKKKRWGSSVGIATGYGLDDRSSSVRFPVEAGNFPLLHRVQTGSGAHPASYPTYTGGAYPGGKAAGAWSWALTSI